MKHALKMHVPVRLYDIPINVTYETLYKYFIWVVICNTGPYYCCGQWPNYTDKYVRNGTSAL